MMMMMINWKSNKRRKLQTVAYCLYLFFFYTDDNNGARKIVRIVRFLSSLTSDTKLCGTQDQ